MQQYCVIRRTTTFLQRNGWTPVAFKRSPDGTGIGIAFKHPSVLGTQAHRTFDAMMKMHSAHWKEGGIYMRDYKILREPTDAPNDEWLWMSGQTPAAKMYFYLGFNGPLKKIAATARMLEKRGAREYAQGERGFPISWTVFFSHCWIEGKPAHPVGFG